MEVKISWIQSHIEWKSPEINLSYYEKVLKKNQARKGNIILLPECFPTGFCMNDPSIIEQHPGPSFEWMRLTASEHQCVLAGSILIHDQGRNFNRLYWVNPDGRYEQYDKVHLYTPGREGEFFTPGKRKVIIQKHGIRFFLTTCYDLRFPVWCRNIGNYDVMINVANWPSMRADHRKILMRSRAIENQNYVIGVNRIGKDGNQLNHIGESMAIDPSGKIIAESMNKEDFHSVTIDLNTMMEYRQKLPFFKDSDEFELKQPFID
ncbi:MAG TPA: nitrilase-related carbon-nitrogen hydrolase [Saprospiraceae bacterium]|nr:nitrilase-related carbon-nitrogen hydrolase [Saprospiraceae bacterium]